MWQTITCGEGLCVSILAKRLVDAWCCETAVLSAARAARADLCGHAGTVAARCGRTILAALGQWAPFVILPMHDCSSLAPPTRGLLRDYDNDNLHNLHNLHNFYTLPALHKSDVVQAEALHRRRPHHLTCPAGPRDHAPFGLPDSDPRRWNPLDGTFIIQNAGGGPTREPVIPERPSRPPPYNPHI